MTRGEATEAANYVMARTKMAPVGVFLIDDKVKTMFPGGARFELMEMEHPDALVGVYTINAYAEDITEDILVTKGYNSLKQKETQKKR